MTPRTEWRYVLTYRPGDGTRVLLPMTRDGSPFTYGTRGEADEAHEVMWKAYPDLDDRFPDIEVRDTSCEAGRHAPLRSEWPGRSTARISGEAWGTIADTWDSSDPWGSCLAHLFGICDVLTLEGEEVPASWQFNPGAGSRDEDDVRDESFEASTWLNAIRLGALDADDLRSVGAVLMRYRDRMEAAGMSY